MKAQALAYIREHRAQGECELHGGALLGSMSYEDWLVLTEENAQASTVHANWVVADTYFVVRGADQRIIGMVDIRHSLNDFLASYGGHIGYGVRPSERRKGYATAILRMALEYAKRLGLKRVMLACYADNVASRKTILRCGGVLERECTQEDGKTVQFFGIALGDEKNSPLADLSCTACTH